MTALLVRSPDLPVKWCDKIALDANLECEMCGGVPMDAAFSNAFGDEG